VLLVGAGTGEATCGILYLASYLRRNGVEAFVRLHDDDETTQELTGSLERLMGRVRPRLVGISLKWFHHLGRAKLIAETLRRIDPEVRLVLGGNTASWFWRELGTWESIDDVVTGDGEVPLLALCRGEVSPPNCIGADGSRAPLGYVQGAGSREVHYSHFDELFLSLLDQHSFSGWVAPGKGCGENCVYCGGGRGLQEASFGRARPFLRPPESVRRDHREIAPLVWQLRYDFSGGTAEFLAQTWKGLDLSGHSTTYFLWGVPPEPLVELLASTFGRVYLVLDLGCFSSDQRSELHRRGLLKRCPTDGELLDAVRRCLRYSNVELEVCGIAGLPFTSAQALDQEHRLIEQLLGLGCAVGYQRLESQPGALVTEHAGRFGMVSQARSFDEFLGWFSRGDPARVGPVPMVRFVDRNVERSVERAFEHLDELVQRQVAHATAIDDDSRLKASVASMKQVALSDWFGSHRVPPSVAKEQVTVVRSINGSGLACAPSLSSRRFNDPLLQQGAAGSAVLAALTAFSRPTTVGRALASLGSNVELDLGSWRELVEHLAHGRFLQRA